MKPIELTIELQDDGRPIEGTRPLPPRWRGLTRALLLVGVVLAVVAGVRLGWGWLAQVRLDRYIADLRAAGRPVRLEDLETNPPPADENAAVLYTQAWGQIVSTLGESVPCTSPDGLQSALQVRIGVHDFEMCGPGFDRAAYVAAWGRLIDANKKPLEILAKAAELPACDWELQTPGLAAGMSIIGGFSETRTLVQLAHSAAITRHEQGRDEEALAHLLNGTTFCNRIHDPRGYYIRTVVAHACQSLMTSTVERIASNVQINRDGASEAQVRALIDALLDGETATRDWWEALHGEAGYMIASVSDNMQLPASSLTDYLLPPLWLDGMRAGVECLVGVAEAGQSPRWYDAHVALPAIRHRDASIWEHIDPLQTCQQSLYLDAGLRSAYRLRTRRRMAALALAVRLYVVQHGHRPARLTDLVPEYIPELPDDPFHRDGGTFHYVPAGDWPRLYSVGANGHDDRGYFSRRSVSHVGETIDEVLEAGYADDVALSLDGRRATEVGRVRTGEPIPSEDAERAGDGEVGVEQGGGQQDEQ